MYDLIKLINGLFVCYQHITFYASKIKKVDENVENVGARAGAGAG